MSYFSVWTAVLLAMLATVHSGEYCDDFEDGDFGQFWEQTTWPSSAQWIATSYGDVKKTVPDFPEPKDGQTIVYFKPNVSRPSSKSADLYMTGELIFPENSTISFLYWLRSENSGKATVTISRIGDIQSFHFISSTGPSHTWQDTGAIQIPSSKSTTKIIISGWHDGFNKSDIAIDDIIVKGPDGLDHPCKSETTTAETTTTTLPTTTATTEPTTSSEPTTTSTVAPTVESTTAAPSTAVTTSAAPSAAPAGRRLGSSVLLAAALGLLALSLLLLLVVSLVRRHGSGWRRDQLPLVRQTSSCGDIGESAGGGWYDYIVRDPWNHVRERLKHL